MNISIYAHTGRIKPNFDDLISTNMILQRDFKSPSPNSNHNNNNRTIGETTTHIQQMRKKHNPVSKTPKGSVPSKKNINKKKRSFIKAFKKKGSDEEIDLTSDTENQPQTKRRKIPPSSSKKKVSFSKDTKLEDGDFIHKRRAKVHILESSSSFCGYPTFLYKSQLYVSDKQRKARKIIDSASEEEEDTDHIMTNNSM